VHRAVSDVLTLEEVQRFAMTDFRDRILKRLAKSATVRIRYRGVEDFGDPVFIPSLAELGYVAGLIALLESFT